MITTPPFAQLMIPAREERDRTYVALSVLLVVERDGRLVAWCGDRIVCN